MATLSIRVVTDVAQAKRALNDLSGAVDGLEGDLDKLSGPAAGAVGAIGLIGYAAINAASDAQQSAGAIEAVFGKFADQINANARTAATSVGLATTEYQQFATVLGSQLANMGMPMDQVAGQTDELISLGADLAATYGGTTADAVSALSSLMRGERDPIERYGVSINQAAIDAQLAAMGLDGLTGAAATNANAQATLALLTDQTSAAQGQFARETDTAAGAQQIATAQWKDAAAELGAHLLPAVTAVTENLGSLAIWVGENTVLVGVLLGVIGLFAGSILAANAAIKIYRGTQLAISAATKAWTIAQAALNLVMSLNPVMLVVLAIGALIAAVVIAYQRSETFRNIVNRLWSAIKSGASTVVGWFRLIGQWVSHVAGLVLNGLGSAWNWVYSRWSAFYNSVSSGFQWIISLIRSARNWISSLFSQSMPGWMRTVTSWFGFAAIAPADDPASQIARAATYGTPSAMSELVAPAAFAPASGAAGPGASGSPTIVNIRIEGAVDREGTARQILDLLNTYGLRRGQIALGAS